jgi:hypothetical protein
MKTLNWRHTDWFAKNFIFSIGQEIIGQLTFNSSWNFNAVYTDKETNLKFSQKNFWDRDVLVTKDGKSIGEISFRLFGTQTLKLVTGERFTLSSSFWGQEIYWKNENGKTIVKYRQATMSSMGKGLINLTDSLATDVEKLLISSGLFTRQLMHKRIALLVAVMIPVFVASRRH